MQTFGAYVRREVPRFSGRPEDFYRQAFPHIAKVADEKRIRLIDPKDERILLVTPYVSIGSGSSYDLIVEAFFPVARMDDRIPVSYSDVMDLEVRVYTLDALNRAAKKLARKAEATKH